MKAKRFTDRNPPSPGSSAGMAGDPIPPHSPTLLHSLTSFDTSLSLLIHTHSLPIPRFLLKALEISGDGRLWFPILIALLLYFHTSPSLFPFLAPLFLGSLLDLLLVGLLKTLVRRPRPLYNKGMALVVSVDHWSFPSGHSSRVSFAATFLYIYSKKRYGGEAGELVVHAVLIWAAATSASRVLLGRHFLLDVLAGACLGVVEALFVYHYLKF